MSGTHLILVADSDVALLKRVTSLAKQEGYQVVTTSSGANVVDMAVHHRPELIVLDVAFPDADGRDLLRSQARSSRLITTAGVLAIVESS